MDLDLAGKVALVTGASQGLGLAIARAMAAEGAAVALVARSASKLEAQATALTAEGAVAMGVPADLTDWPSLSQALEAVRRQLGDPDILVFNSGGPPPVEVTKVDPDLWRVQFEAMVMSAMRLTESVLPAMRARRFGRILTVASTSVVEPIQGLAISNSLRGALAGWMKTLSREVARDGITVNLLLPGSFATERIDTINRRAAESEGVSLDQIVARTSAAIPVGRYGDPSEFAAVAAFLASPRASYVSGTMVRVDGGSTAGL